MLFRFKNRLTAGFLLSVIVYLGRCLAIYGLLSWSFLTPTNAVAQSNSQDDAQIINDISDIIAEKNTFAFVLPMYFKLKTFNKTGSDINSRLDNSDYIFVYTPYKARENNVWFLVERNRSGGGHQIIGRGGAITYLKADMFDAPGFDEESTASCIRFWLFPQRRVQSCKSIECRSALHLTGENGSPNFTVLQGRKGWHILHEVEFGEMRYDCLFNSGEMTDLLEMGDRTAAGLAE